MVDPKTVGPATYAAMQEIAKEIARATPPERVIEWAGLTSGQTTELHSHSGGGAHPDLATHDALGLATDTDLSAHVAASDPHTGYVREADASWVDLTDGGATTLHSHSGGAVADPNPQAYAPGSFTVATGKYVILCAPVLTGAQAATVQGTGMMRVI